MIDSPPDWRNGRNSKAVEEIEAAIDRLDHDDWYEQEHGRLSDTLGHLKKIGELAPAFVDHIRQLSPVAKGALHDRGLGQGADLGRHGLAALSKTLEVLGVIAPLVAYELLHRHSPTHEPGQGAGSAAGRESDLRTLPAGDDELRDLSLRSPADRFGVAVMAAVIRYECEDRSTLSGKRYEHHEFLQRIWASVRADKKVNWARVLNARSRIAEFVERNEHRARAAEACWPETSESRIISN